MCNNLEDLTHTCKKRPSKIPKKIFEFDDRSFICRVRDWPVLWYLHILVSSHLFQPSSFAQLLDFVPGFSLSALLLPQFLSVSYHWAGVIKTKHSHIGSIYTGDGSLVCDKLGQRKVNLCTCACTSSDNSSVYKYRQTDGSSVQTNYTYHSSLSWLYKNGNTISNAITFVWMYHLVLFIFILHNVI